MWKADPETLTTRLQGAQPVLGKGPAGTIPYPRRNLIKFLMRAIGISSYTPGTNARPLVPSPLALPTTQLCPGLCPSLLPSPL